MLCHYAECPYAECRISFAIMLNVVLLSVIMLSVVAPNIFLTLGHYMPVLIQVNGKLNCGLREYITTLGCDGPNFYLINNN